MASLFAQGLLRPLRFAGLKEAVAIRSLSVPDFGKFRLCFRVVNHQPLSHATKTLVSKKTF
jgi:hypothetical protein